MSNFGYVGLIIIAGGMFMAILYLVAIHKQSRDKDDAEKQKPRHR